MHMLVTRTLPCVPHEPGPPETNFVYVPREPSSAGQFARHQPGRTLLPGNQTAQNCTPRARPGHIQQTKRAQNKGKRDARCSPSRVGTAHANHHWVGTGRDGLRLLLVAMACRRCGRKPRIGGRRRGWPGAEEERAHMPLPCIQARKLPSRWR
jgi:hypothetical protein